MQFTKTLICKLPFRVLSVLSLEPCEFLKISTNDYKRVIQVLFFIFTSFLFVYFFLVTLSLKLHCTRILAKPHLLQYFLFPSNTQQLIQAREEEQKLSLVKTCKLFHNWPLLSLKKISGLVKWRRFSPGQGSLSRWREETHIVSLFYIKFSYLLVNFLYGLVCSRWLFVRLDL